VVGRLLKQFVTIKLFFSPRVKQPRKSLHLQQFSFPSVPAPLQDDNVTATVRLLRSSTTQQSIAWQ